MSARETETETGLDYESVAMRKAHHQDYDPYTLLLASFQLSFTLHTLFTWWVTEKPQHCCQPALAIEQIFELIIQDQPVPRFIRVKSVRRIFFHRDLPVFLQPLCCYLSIHPPQKIIGSISYYLTTFSSSRPLLPWSQLSSQQLNHKVMPKAFDTV